MRSRFRDRTGRRFAVPSLMLGALVFSGLGCNFGDRPVVIQGKVTFQGQPVTEGTVQFNDEKTGHGAEVELGPEGVYKATLPEGEYAVVILPPLLNVESKSGPPDPQFKKVRNIPEKYRSTVTSGLTAAVSEEKTVHDFALSP